MQFTFNEGHIQLPSQWQDQSMQVLVSTDNSGINLVITREAVPQGTLTRAFTVITMILTAIFCGKQRRTAAPPRMNEMNSITCWPATPLPGGWRSLNTTPHTVS